LLVPSSPPPEGRLPLHEAAYLELSSSQLDLFVSKHRLHVGASDIHPLRSTGIVHTIYALGENYVLRVPKDHPEAIADAYTGSVAAPAAYVAGVRTPALVAFDDDGDITRVPLSLLERAAGEPLLDTGPHPQALAPLWRELGRDIAALHGNVTHCDDPNGYLDQHDGVGADDQVIEGLRAEGVLGPDAARWLERILDRLRPAIAERGTYRRFVHGDLQAPNVLAVEGRYGALIDWDDAGWADPVVDLRYLPLGAIDAVLQGYRSVMPVDGDSSAEERALWDKLNGALLRLRRPPRPAGEAVSGTPAGPLIELLAAAADGDVPIMRLLRR
jgi:aminoglycoside phosphotransferase (APT) family kinase protein